MDHNSEPILRVVELVRKECSSLEQLGNGKYLCHNNDIINSFQAVNKISSSPTRILDWQTRNIIVCSTEGDYPLGHLDFCYWYETVPFMDIGVILDLVMSIWSFHGGSDVKEFTC